MAHRNTAYWPERFTPLSLLAEARKWRELASEHLNAAAHAAAHQHLRQNAGRATQRAEENPTPANLNAAGSMGHLVADSAGKLAENLATLSTRCPEPPCSVIAYREPGEPASWVAEVVTHCGHERTPAIRTWSPGPPTKEEAIAALRECATHPDLIRQAKGSDYHAARVRAAIRAAAEAEPVEVRIRLAGEERPTDWEESK